MKMQRGDDIGNNNSLSGAVQDCLFLSLVVLLSLILYVQGLGFYSDDWDFFGYLSTSWDHSLTGLFRQYPHLANRPVQLLYLTGLYWLFGPHPLGYHLVNAAVLVSSIVLFYLVLRELGEQRVLTLAAPVVYALLPHYSTDRFWIIVFPANLSIALYFLSLYSDLRTVRTRRAPLWGWKLLSILSLLVSALAYEVALPLFLLNPLLVLYRRRQLYGSVPDRKLSRGKLAVLFGSNLLALMLVMVFKALTTTRVHDIHFKSHSVWFAQLIAKAIIVSYGDYGLGLPGLIWKILRDYPNWPVFAVGGVLCLIVFGYIYRVASQSKAELASKTSMLRFIVWGLVVFGMGYAIFLTNKNAEITTTGLWNRTAIAAAVGVAISMVGGLGWVSTLLPSNRLRIRCFCILVALLCTSGFVINNTLASFWISAYRQQQVVLADIRQHFPTLPASSILLLDGVCPYIGPGIVFEYNWDLSEALKMLYRDRTLQGDVVTPNLKVREDGISKSLYSNAFNSHYPYDKKLFVYNFGRKMTYPLTDAKAARLYFQTFNPDHSSGCPQGYEGYGVRVF